MAKMPIDVKKLLDAVTSIGEERDRPVNVDLVFDPTASERLVSLMLDAFIEPVNDAHVEVSVLGMSVPDLYVPADLCVVVGGDSLLLGDVASAARAKGIPAVVAVARGETFFADDMLGAQALAKTTAEQNVSCIDATGAAPVATGKGIPLSDVIDVDLSEGVGRPLEELGTWIVQHVPAKRTSMASDFPFLRHPLAVELGRSCAIQNAAIGVVFFVPGADMPLITLNQARMTLQIAAVYGRDLSSERIGEVAAVVAGGFGFRALARKLAGSIPLLGWAIKPGVAAGGTLAMSYAAIDFYEEGGALNGAAKQVVDIAGKVVERAGEVGASADGAGETA